MQNSNYNISDYKVNSLKLKLIKQIDKSLSFMITLLSIIGFIEFIRFCFDLYSYLH